ncbi:MAG: cyclic nucleotide-binding domain-containing protein [Candidatus Hydrogenedentes bacterium]|nr:cyclic nucleotide-binding domain-containing protein [Candidatus Hydrogenedentota bacterium]
MANDNRGSRFGASTANAAEALPESIGALPRRSLAAGDILVEENSKSGKLYFLASGAVEVRKNGVQIAEVSEVGAAFGEMSVLLDTPHTAAVLALCDSEVHVVDAPESFLREHPEVTLYVAKLLARRLNALNRYLVDVKRQFGEQSDHLAMVDEVLDALMNKHPRTIERRPAPGP